MIAASRAPRLRGVIPPVLTPFRADRSVDYAAWDQLIEWLIEHGVNGLFVSGGSGEWTHLTVEERVELTGRAVRVAQGHVPVIAGSLGRDFDESLSLSRAMADAGINFLGVIIPRFVAPRDETIYAFFERLIERLPYPTMLYDPPGSGDHALQPSWLRRLAPLDPIVGLKKTTRDLRVFAQLILAAGEGFAMIAGDETVMLPCLAVGAVGCIGGGANTFPELLGEVFESFGRGDWETARHAHFEIERANRLLERGSWPLTGKIALAARGLPIEPITRCRSQPPTADDRRKIEDYMRQRRFAR